MDFSRQPVKPANKFWTPARLSLMLVVFALLAAMSIAGCNSSTNAPKGNESGSANSPKAGGTSSNPGGGDGVAPSANSGVEKSNAAPPTAVMLPAIALDAPLKTIDGKDFKLSELKGKVLVIDLWATWCGPCRYEVPELVKMQDEYGPRGFEIIGLDIDPDSDSPEDVRKFIKEFSINYKVAFAEESLARSLMRGGNIPQSMVVDREGRIVEHLVGFHPLNTPKKMRAAIEQALQ
ncbi:MAG TPA: TlpA disulfide reductase family protein [Pyrinomonadaceae bacterium]